MKNAPAYIISQDSITIVSNGKPYTTSSANANFATIKQRIADEQFDGIEELFDTGAAVGVYTKGNIVVKDGEVLYKGEPVHNLVVERILTFMREGLPTSPLINFLEKLLQNPSRRSVQELYKFLENKGLPLTPEGCFLGYKSLRPNWTDHHTGTILNKVGTVVEMVRNQVDDDAAKGCSFGYHIANLNYAQNFGGADKILVIVEVNPADVVSVPLESCEKLRTCRYRVVGTFEREFNEPLVTQYSTPEEIEASEDLEEQLIDDSYHAGYAEGAEDACCGLNYDEDLAYDNADLDYDATAFLDGYYDGFEENKIIKPVAKIKPSTRAKLSKAAKKQKRNSSGRFA